jgi:hypothetical protein
LDVEALVMKESEFDMIPHVVGVVKFSIICSVEEASGRGERHTLDLVVAGGFEEGETNGGGDVDVADAGGEGAEEADVRRMKITWVT